jgi:hypothetical protein
MVLGLLLIGVLSIGGLGLELRKRHQPPPMDAAAFMRFALLPGERYGAVWQAVHPSGEAMIVTITSTGILAANYAVAQAAPVRLRPEGVSVAVGAHHMITPGAVEPMVDVTISSGDQSPLAFRLALSSATAISAWARPSS